MKVELNIGLDINDKTSSENDYAARATLALHRLRGMVVGAKRFVTSYEGPAGTVTEHGLFVALDTNISFALEHRVFHLAAELNQDCIGSYYPETGRGSLIGPKSENWGSFQLAFFKRFEAEPERLAA